MKKEKLSQERQSEMFRKTAQELMDDGELNPTEADDALSKIVKASKMKGKGDG